MEILTVSRRFPLAAQQFSATSAGSLSGGVGKQRLSDCGGETWDLRIHWPQLNKTSLGHRTSAGRPKGRNW